MPFRLDSVCALRYGDYLSLSIPVARAAAAGGSEADRSASFRYRKGVTGRGSGPRRQEGSRDLLKLSDAHLQAAFNAISNNNHDAAERELDIYNKAVAEAGKETFALKEGRRTLSKKIEQTLYRQIKTLESIDRLFPAERAGFSDAALKHAKQLRVHGAK